MIIIRDMQEWQRLRSTFSSSLKIGFVPTMGCLHQGHASLLKRCREENDLCVLSIFINPVQFNDSQDYQHYPRTIEQDLAMAKEHHIDYVLMPEVDAIYPNGNLIFIDTIHPLAKSMEGKQRPGHFSGVLTVVMKLLLLVKAHHVYLGEKDYQQLSLIQQLIKDYFIDTQVIACASIREPSGLPFSSRNTRLSAQEKSTVEDFYQQLLNSSLNNIHQIETLLEQFNLKKDYVEIHNNRLFLAFRIGPIRIIDNHEVTLC